MTPEERRAYRRRKNPQIHAFETALREETGLSETVFHRVGFDRWEAVYERIADRFADRTRDRKNGLHWANIKGYSPWAMERLAGCRQGDPQSWFFCLPELLPEEGAVYLLLEVEWGRFWLFEGEVAAVAAALEVLSGTAFLGLGYLDYYLVSRKLRWIIGFNHHDIVSLAGEGFEPRALAAFLSPDKFPRE